MTPRSIAWIINSIVLVNACLHDPAMGYDAENHLQYLAALGSLHWPRPPEVYEYFSPPLPYLFPAALMVVFGASAWSAAKVALFVNVLLSIVATRSLVRLCEAVRPGDARFAAGTLGCLALVPAYYRTFAMFRGEPFIVAFTLLAACEGIALLRGGGIAAAARMGGWLGLASLSRQWAFGAWVGIGAFLAWQILVRGREGLPLLGRTVAGFLLAIAIAGTFYAHLLVTYGRLTPFNRAGAAELAISNQPSDFYLGLDLAALRWNPIRPAAPNRLPTIFYADLWGDYWGYFSVYARDTVSGRTLIGTEFEAATASDPPPPGIETNRPAMAAAIGRADVLGVLPASLFAIGWAAGLATLRRAGRLPFDDARLLSAFVVSASLALFLWFLVMYPEPKEGDTIKASYMIQCLPFLALLAADRLARLRASSRRAYAIVVGMLIVTFVHNLPMAITRHVAWSG